MRDKNLEAIESFGMSKLAGLEYGLQIRTPLGKMLNDINDLNDAVGILKRNNYDLRKINERRTQYFERAQREA